MIPKARSLIDVKKIERLRAILSKSRAVMALSTHNALSAKFVEAAEFPVVWTFSSSVSSGQRALADVYLPTMTETLEVVRHVNEDATVPVIAGRENGYGDAMRVTRNAEEYEKSGTRPSSFRSILGSSA